LLEGQEEAFASAADATKHCISEDRLVYLIGAIRIRSLKRATIALSASPPSQNLGKRRKAASRGDSERPHGAAPRLAERILSRYPIKARDVVVVFSTSGVNAVPVEAAKYARAAGVDGVVQTTLCGAV
jgi:uncharacterized phosphosugar-binding protein